MHLLEQARKKRRVFEAKRFSFIPASPPPLQAKQSLLHASSNILDIHLPISDLPLHDLLFTAHLEVARVRLRLAEQTFLSATLELFCCELLRQRATGWTVTDRREETWVCVRKACTLVSQQAGKGTRATEAGDILWLRYCRASEEASRFAVFEFAVSTLPRTWSSRMVSFVLRGTGQESPARERTML